jgi:hypothetical protein
MHEPLPGSTAPAAGAWGEAAGWQPDGAVEERLLAARRDGDEPAFLLALAGTRLLLPAPEAPADGWVVSVIAGRTCVLAFTSPAAMAAAGRSEADQSGADPALRAIGPLELAARWPGPDLFLAVDPGLPVEAYLDAGSVQDLAELAAQPATAAEARLSRALAGGDLAAYLEVLLPAEMYVPLAGDPDGAELRAPGFPWLRLTGNPEAGTDPDAPVVAFTSMARLADAVGPRPWMRRSFALLVDVWPEGRALAVDPGLEHGARLDGAVLAHLRENLRISRDAGPSAGGEAGWPPVSGPPG